MTDIKKMNMTELKKMMMAIEVEIEDRKEKEYNEAYDNFIKALTVMVSKYENREIENNRSTAIYDWGDLGSMLL